MNSKGEAKQKLDQAGIEQICDWIVERKTMTAIADAIGVSIGSLIVWINSDPEHSARAREARAETAKLWDEQATKVIENAPDEFELKKARELAHHYRWRASKIAPKEYGERLEIENKGIPMVVIKDFTGRQDDNSDD